MFVLDRLGGDLPGNRDVDTMALEVGVEMDFVHVYQDLEFSRGFW